MSEKISHKSLRSAGPGIIYQHGKLYPSVSIILPVDNQYPHFKDAEFKLKSMVKEAEAILNTELSKKKAEPIILELRRLVETINFTKLSKGLALFVSPAIHKVIHLAVPVEEKLIVGSSFELRDLFFAAKSNFHYLVLAISENGVCLFFGDGNQFREVQNNKMPAGIRDIPAEGNSPEEYLEAFNTSQAVSDEDYYSKDRMIKYFRIIDDVLTEIIKPAGRKVILCSVQKKISSFLAITKNKNAIIGTVEGNFEYLNEEEVFKKIEPVLSERQKQEEKGNLRLLDEALSKKIFISGLENVWRAVLERKGRLLFVEKGFHQSGRPAEDQYTLITENGESNKTKKNTDVVDDIIEYTFEYGGDVAFMEDGTLSQYGRIALLSYYSE